MYACTYRIECIRDRQGYIRRCIRDRQRTLGLLQELINQQLSLASMKTAVKLQ